MRVALVLGLLLAGCLAEPPAEPAPAPAPFAFGAQGCTEVRGVVPVPADAVADRVPPGYQIQAEQSGGATLLVAIVQCANGTLEKTIQNPAWSAAGVAIESPDGSGGSHAYLLWWLSDAAPLEEALAAWSIGNRMQAPTFVDAVSDAGSFRAGNARASAPWLEGPYDVQVDIAGPAIDQSIAQAWWIDVPEPTRIHWTLEGSQNQGFGRVNAAGGPLREILGQETVPAAASYMTGRSLVEIV